MSEFTGIFSFSPTDLLGVDLSDAKEGPKVLRTKAPEGPHLTGDWLYIPVEDVDTALRKGVAGLYFHRFRLLIAPMNDSLCVVRSDYTDPETIKRFGIPERGDTNILWVTDLPAGLWVEED